MSKETTALKDPDTLYRLPRNVVPEKYEIRLEPDLVNFTFDGEETVHIIIAEPTKEILLNALELEILECNISNTRGETFEASVSFDVESERAALTFKEELSAGTWKLFMKFKGILNDKLHGFYRSTYKDETGATKIIATTQMEATDARRAFPCWDEPDFKATYRITLIVDQNLKAISNARIRSEKMLPERGKREVHFQETMKMSTYLVAFIVGEFDQTDEQIVDGTPIRIIAPPGKLPLATFAQGCAAHALAFFNGYYGLKYPGDKLDLIAIPDFAFGAMENLGAVTFRETALLVDEKTASHAELERVADVVAHEIAHMWFGDLATMKWWNGIWLNEAFATFMQILATHVWQPNWKRWETFGVSRALAFDTDGLTSTRTIEFPVHHPQEASAMFDVLTYQKGGSVLRMLEQYLGEEQFRRGIMLYLAKHKYANTETTDLWDAIEESCKQPVRDMMDSWIFQEGHPLVSVERGAAPNEIKLTQQRFLYMQNAGTNSKTMFQVPIMVKAKIGKEIEYKKLMLKEESTTVAFEAKPEWVVVNEGGHGFYRVRYTGDLLKELTNNLSQIAPIERFNLVNDTWASVMAGLTPLSQYLKLISLFSSETDKNVWTVIVGSLQYLERVAGTSDQRALPETFTTFVRNLIGPALNNVGWEPKPDEDSLTGQLRGMLIGALGTLGDDHETKEKAADLYYKYRSDRTSVSPDVAPALVSILAFSGDEARYNEFVREFKDAKTPQEEDRYMYALASFREPSLLHKTLEKTLNGEVRTQNAPFLVRMLMMNTAGRDVSWNFFKDNWETILKIFPNNSITRMCEGVTGLVSEPLAKDARDFFQKHPLKQGGKSIDQSLEKLQVAVAMQKREAETLKSFKVQNA